MRDSSKTDKNMPVDLKKFQRIFLIHQKLRTKRHFSWESLADACERKLDVNVSQRTIEYDISTLKNEFHAPVQKRKGLYHYTEPYSIFEVFDDSEYGSLNELLALLRQQKANEFIGMEEIFLRLEQRVSILGGEQSQIIAFEQNPLKGIENLEKLYKYINENRALEIEYKPFDLPPYNRIIKPVLLKQYNNRWFLFAWEKDKDSIQNIALDRINTIVFSAEEIKTKENFEASTYFNDIVGVSVIKDKTNEIVKFRIKKPRAFYVETKPFHNTQTIISDDEKSLTFEINVIINRELEAKLMGYGNDILILEPKNLQTTIKEMLKNTLKEYDKLI